MLFPPFYLLVYRHRTNFREAGSLKSLVESRNRTQDVLTMRQLCQPLEYNHDYVLWNTFRRLNLSVKAKQILVTFCPSVLHRDNSFSFKKFRQKGQKWNQFESKILEVSEEGEIGDHFSQYLISKALFYLNTDPGAKYFTQPKDTKAGCNLAIENV